MKTTLLGCAAATLITASLFAQEAPKTLQVAQNAAQVEWLGSQPFIDGQVLVRFQEGVDLELAGELIDADRFVVEETLIAALNLFLVRILDETPVAMAIQDLERSEWVQYAAPDHIVSNRDTLPNDPSFGSQWAHTKMQSAKAWDFGQGSASFVVAVVDGGCRLNHADIAPNLYVNTAEASGSPGVDDDGNGYVDDINGWNAYNNNGTIPNDGHGTHVNGIVGARGNNGAGVAGVNWNVDLMPIAGSSGSTSTVTKAYGYALAQKTLWLNTGGAKGANVVATNSSFGVDQGNCGSNAYKPWNDSLNAMGAVGILSCGATANANWNIDAVGDVPTGCSSPYMVSVTNTTSADAKNNGAGYGLNTIDLGAPGTSILSTYSNGGYTNLTGTSMASPQVAGAIGFLHSVASPAFVTLRNSDPAGAALALKTVILQSVDPLPALAGKTVSGGRLNLFKAATAINTWTNGGGGGTDGTLTSYGPSTGANIGTLASPSTPNIGNLVTFNASGFANTSILRLVVGTAQASTPQFGGTLLVNFATKVVDQTFAVFSGNGSFGAPLPNSAGLIGLTFYAQVGGLDATQSQGVAMSNGLAMTIGF